MPGDLRLGRPENLYKVADADFVTPHQVQQAQPCTIAKCAEQKFNVDRSRGRLHESKSSMENIFVLTDVKMREYIRLLRCIGGGE